MAESQRPRAARPTMNDVAHAAGVGLKTVSRVVNGEGGVLDGTAERVREAIERLGYRRNDSARLLRRGQTASVGLVIEDVADPFYSELTRAVEEVTRQHGSLVFTGSSDENPERERELVLAFCARRVDGLVVVPAGTSHRYLLPELAAGIAVVFVDRPPGDIDADTVLSANSSGAKEGVRHLLSRGHRRIAFVGDSADIFTAAQRLDGYRAALRDAGVPVDESLIVMGHLHPEFVRAALDKLVDRDDAPTALFTSNSRATVAALRALGTHTTRPALVGFDDFELADLVTPAVTVVAQDPTGLGREAAELLFRRLQGDPSPVQHIELPTRLIQRGSGELPPSP
jgi:LacI family transcriptional regulator, galactose operon repressor